MSSSGFPQELLEQEGSFLTPLRVPQHTAPLFSAYFFSPGCSTLSPWTTSAVSHTGPGLQTDESHVPWLELSTDPFLMLPVN